MLLTRVLRNLAALSTSTILERALTFVLFLFIARFLGSAGLGEYALAFSFLTIFGTVSHFGQNFVIVREVARDRAQTGRYFTSSLLLVGAGALLCALVMAAAVRVLGYPAETVAGVSIMALALIPNSLVSVPEAIFQGWERMEFITIYRFISNLLGTGASIGLLLSGAPLTAVFWVLAAQRALLLSLYILILYRKIPGICWQPDRAFLAGLVRVSLTFTVISVLVALVNNVDMLLLLRLHDATITGFYAAALKPVRLLSLGAPMLMMAIYPSLSAHYEGAIQGFHQIIKTSLRLLFLVIPPVALVISLAAGPLVRLMYGPGYESSVLGMQILAWTLPPLFCGAVLFRGLMAGNRERVLLRVAAVNLMVNIVLNIVLIPTYGGPGAAVAALAAALTGFVQGYWAMRKLAPLNLWRMSFRPMASCALAGVVFFAGWGPVPARLLLAGFVYLAGLLLSGAVSRRELLGLRTLWEDIRKGLTSIR